MGGENESPRLFIEAQSSCGDKLGRLCLGAHVTMADMAISAVRYRFGVFEFYSAAGELRRAGELVRLQGQPAVALECLLARVGEVVTREELQQAIWGDETHVDF